MPQENNLRQEQPQEYLLDHILSFLEGMMELSVHGI
jgi:hypothetical protein